MVQIPLVVKTLAGIDVSKEYAAKTGKLKKPGLLTQRLVGAVLGLVCSYFLKEYAIPAGNIDNFLNLVWGNWDAFAETIGVGWGVIVLIKGAIQKKRRGKVETLPQTPIAPIPAPQDVSGDTFGNGSSGN
jgi:hypothetical protein